MSDPLDFRDASNGGRYRPRDPWLSRFVLDTTSRAIGLAAGLTLFLLMPFLCGGCLVGFGTIGGAISSAKEAAKPRPPAQPATFQTSK